MVELQQQDILTIILLGTFGILLLIGSIGSFILLYQKRLLEEKQMRIAQELAYQTQMINMQLESQEQERKRIGAELHDSLGSLLWGAKVNASYIQRSVDLEEHVMVSYNELVQILDESINVVRRISWELTPEAFHYSGLSKSIEKMCSRLGGKGQEIVLEESGAMLWNDERALQVFRIAQELISNAHKHSGATKIITSLNWGQETLQLKVKDNGSGFDVNKFKNGVGLWNVSQRVKQLKGKMIIGNPPMKPGTEVSVEISYKHDKAKTQSLLSRRP